MDKKHVRIGRGAILGFGAVLLVGYVILFGLAAFRLIWAWDCPDALSGAVQNLLIFSLPAFGSLDGAVIGGIIAAKILRK